MKSKKAQPVLRLVVSDSSRRLSPFHGHVIEPELPIRNGFDLPRPPLREFAAPHGDGLPAATKRIRKGLVSATKMLKNLREGHHGRKWTHTESTVSVSTLPHTVKPLTRKQASMERNLAYMASPRRAPKSPWTVERGKTMKDAREALGLTQAGVADLAGCTREYVSQCESGITGEIDLVLVKKFAQALGLLPTALSKKWDGVDEGKDLRVSSIARHVAYNFDDYPLVIQNEIRATIARYQAAVKQLGKVKARQLYSPTPPAEAAREARQQGKGAG